MKHEKINRMVSIALLAAVVVVLQLLAGMIKIGTFSITLTLIPIIVGAAFYGPSAGAILGAVFGVVVYIGCVTGSDVGGNMVFVANPFLCFLVVMAKGALAGFCAGLVYRLVMKGRDSVSRGVVAVILAGITAPVVNTGVFCIGMLLFFRGTLQAWAAGSDLFNYIIFSLTGVNFLIELGINVVFSPAIVTIIRAVQKSRA
ncbi:MAG: ECF transporter S component [Faecousia sp.]